MIALNQLEHEIRNGYFSYTTIRQTEQDKFSSDDIDNLRLTRSLVGFYLKNYTNCSDDKISSHIVDGYGDNGIDGIFYDPNEKVLHLIQSKWIKNGNSGIELGDIEKSITGIRRLFIPDLSTFNAEIKALEQEINDALLEPNVNIVFAIVTSTNQTVSKEIEKLLDDFLAEQNNVTNFLYWEYSNLKLLHDVLRRGSVDTPIDIDLLLLNWSDMKDPAKAVLGSVNGIDVANLLETNGKRVFSPNIRYFLGKTEVNSSIIETTIGEPEIFWYLNNGITAIASSVEKKAMGGSSHATGIFHCKGFYIVNGAQTTGALLESKKKGTDLSKVIVGIRIIEVNSENPEFGTKITRSTNTQNRVDSRDFVALDPIQEKIHQELLIDGVNYAYKAGDIIQDITKGFHFEEAAISMACSLDNVDLMVQGKREISKLWSQTDKPPYKLLFNSGTNGRLIFRNVKIMREVESWIKDQASTTTSRDRLIMVHGNRFILQLTFKELRGANPSQEEVTKSAEKTFLALKQIIDLDYGTDQLASLFKNGDKCKKIYDQVLSV